MVAMAAAAVGGVRFSVGVAARVVDAVVVTATTAIVGGAPRVAARLFGR